MRMTVPTIIEFVTDPQLLGLHLSPAQETLLRSIYGLPLTGEQLQLWRRCTGRDAYHAHGFAEATILAGARAGKDSRIAAPMVVYEAVFGDHDRHLARGERGVVPLVAQNVRATRIAFSYVREYVRRSPVLAALITDERVGEIDLTTGISIYAFPCSGAALRGWSIPAAVLDELAFFRVEGGADSDAEIQMSLRRGMVSFARTRLIEISTPYLRSGVLFDDFTRAWGQDDPDLLVWRASSLLMNPTLHAERLAREQRLDPTRYAREYLGEFTSDADAFLPRAWVDAAVVADRHDLPARDDLAYVGTCDPSGGGAEAFALCVSHLERVDDDQTLVVDVLRSHRRVGAQAPNLTSVVREYADILRAYGLTQVLGDRYAGAWVRQAFAETGIEYIESQADKSAAYLALQLWFVQGRVALPDDPTLVRELENLERRPRPHGRDRIDHPRGHRDDLANVVALAAALLSRRGLGEPRWFNANTPSSELTAEERDAVDAEETKQAAEYITRSIKREGVWWPSFGRGDMGDGWR